MWGSSYATPKSFLSHPLNQSVLNKPGDLTLVHFSAHLTAVLAMVWGCWTNSGPINFIPKSQEYNVAL